MFIIQDRECGYFIDEFDTYEQAKKTLFEYEEQDKKDGYFTPDFYEIVEK